MAVVVVNGKHRATPNRRMWWQVRESARHFWFHWCREVKSDWVELRHDYGVWLKERGNMCPECDRWRSAGREVGRKLGVVQERKRIIKLLGDFWCGEPACKDHPVRMDWVIDAIKKDTK